MRPIELVGSWPGATALAVLAHVVVLLLPARTIDQEREPLEFIDFELAEPLLPEPEPDPTPAEPEWVEPEPEPEPEPLPLANQAAAGELVDEPDRAEGVTSLESNRPSEGLEGADVPLVTGLPLDPSQLVEGGMAVRVGNTVTAGFDAQVPVEEIQGFVGGGKGGGGLTGSTRGVDRPAKLVRVYKAPYPDEVSVQRIEGSVVLLVEILPSGRAGHVELLRGVHPKLDQLSIQAMRRCRWRPARLAGEKVAVTQSVTYTWKLTD